MAISSRRAINESNNGGAVHNSSNVKRNNFLSMLGPAGHQEEGQGNHSGVKSPESHSQPNPPTLRKITLNQRIMQKNMARVSGGNPQTILNQSQEAHIQ